jgi:hypothetical protein
MVGLASTPGVHELVLAGVPAAAGEDAVGMVRSTTDVAARFIVADCTDQSAVEALLVNGDPDVIVQCASLMSPWALVDRTDDVARAIASGSSTVSVSRRRSAWAT